MANANWNRDVASVIIANGSNLLTDEDRRLKRKKSKRSRKFIFGTRRKKKSFRCNNEM